MKNLTFAFGIVLSAAFQTLCFAQTSGSGQAITSTANVPINGGTTGNVISRKATSDAEQGRALAEARKKKALMTAMASISPNSRQPVISNASDFLQHNRPPVSATPTNQPYKKPVIYDDIPQFQTGNTTKKEQQPQSTNASSDGNNPYSYPGRVSEGGETRAAPNPEISNEAVATKKRPSFFRWMKKRKTTAETSPPPQPYIRPSVPEEVGGVTAPVPVESDSAAPSPSVSVSRQAPTPPTLDSTNGSGTPSVEVGSPTANPPPAAPPATEPEKKGLFKKLFKRKG